MEVWCTTSPEVLEGECVYPYLARFHVTPERPKEILQQLDNPLLDRPKITRVASRMSLVISDTMNSCSLLSTYSEPKSEPDPDPDPDPDPPAP